MPGSGTPTRQRTFRVEQKQEGERVYRLRTTLRLEIAGREVDEPIDICEKTHSFEIKAEEAPTQLIFDPGDVLLKTVKFEKPRHLWVRQLAAARLGIDRVLAARALADKPDPLSTDALRLALATDSFWGVRAAAAAALGKTRRQDALTPLLAARTQEQPRVRRAVALALGEFRCDFNPGNARAAAALEAWVSDGDPSCFVEASAALALGRLRSPNAVKVLTPVLNRRSYTDVIRTRALEGLGACGDSAAYPVIAEAITRTASFQSRRAAVTALARLAEGTPRARRPANNWRPALAIPTSGCAWMRRWPWPRIGDGRAVAAIERAQAAELDGRTKRKFKQAITQLREKGGAGDKLKKLGEEVERLRGESTRLRERLDHARGREAQPARPRACSLAGAGSGQATPPRPAPLGA